MHRTTRNPWHNPSSSSSHLQTTYDTYTRKPRSQELGTQGQHKTVSKSSCKKKSSCYSSIASLDNSDSDSCEQFEAQSQQFQSPVTVSSASSSQSQLTQESGMSLDSAEMPSDKELQREMKKRQAEVSRIAPSCKHVISVCNSFMSILLTYSFHGIGGQTTSHDHTSI